MIERDWKSDPATGELVIGDDIVMVSGPDSIRQDAEERLGYVRGEWFLEPEDDEAIPLFDRVLVKNPNLAALRSIYEKALLATPGVKTVLSLTIAFDRAARRARIDFRASTDLGEIDGSRTVTVGG